MTAIAYRDGILAADTAVWTGNSERVSIIAEHLSKITRLHDKSLIACAGRSSEIVRVLAWLNEEEFRPTLNSQSNFSAIQVYPNGSVWKLEDDLVPFQIRAEYAVAGGPIEFLLGALAAGASAEQAVQLAINLTDCAAGTVETARV